jgi:hypothetical protein
MMEGIPINYRVRITPYCRDIQLVEDGEVVADMSQEQAAEVAAEIGKLLKRERRFERIARHAWLAGLVDRIAAWYLPRWEQWR